MRGKILEIGEGKGLISGEDLQRYSFDTKDIKSDTSIEVGQTVDFLTEENGVAKDIFLIEEKKTIVIEQVANSEGATIAAVGSGVALLGAIPYVGALFSMAGIILELVGVKKLSNAVNNKSIFSNMLWGLIFSFIASMVLLIGTFFGVISGSVTAMVVVGIIFLAFAISSAIKTFRAYRDLGIEYNLPIFKTSAWLFVVGIITTPIIIGLLFLLAHQICNIIGYMSIRKDKDSSKNKLVLE